jgi:hypothetical protein
LSRFRNAHVAWFPRYRYFEAGDPDISHPGADIAPRDLPATVAQLQQAPESAIDSIVILNASRRVAFAASCCDA